MKNNRNGKAAILSDKDYSKIRSQIKSQKYKLLLDLGRYTGERWGALVQLRVEDVYNANGSPLEYVTFRACTRKAAPDGTQETRQVPVHPVLRQLRLIMGRTRTTWKSGSIWRSGKTTSIRVPHALKDEILAYARSVDSKLINNESHIPSHSGDFLEIIDRYIVWRNKNYRSTQLFIKPDITARTWDELRQLQKLLRQSPELLQD